MGASRPAVEHPEDLVTDPRRETGRHDRSREVVATRAREPASAEQAKPALAHEDVLGVQRRRGHADDGLIGARRHRVSNLHVLQDVWRTEPPVADRLHPSASLARSSWAPGTSDTHTRSQT